MFEHAIKGYVKRSNSCKGIEATFATAEAQQEFLKPLEEAKKDVGKVNNSGNVPLYKNLALSLGKQNKIHGKEKLKVRTNSTVTRRVV